MKIPDLKLCPFCGAAPLSPHVTYPSIVHSWTLQQPNQHAVIRDMTVIIGCPHGCVSKKGTVSLPVDKPVVEISDFYSALTMALDKATNAWNQRGEEATE